MKVYLLFLYFLPCIALSQNDFESAEKYYQQKQFSQAKLLFERFLNDHPNNIKTLEYLGDIQSAYKKWDLAVNYYMTLKNLNPQSANFQYKYGGALAMVAKESYKLKAVTMIDEIESSFLKAIQIDPKHIDARWALVELYLQLPAIIGGSETKSNRYANELLRLSTVDGYLAKGHIAEYFSRYEEAEKQYKVAIAIGNSKATYQKLADLYRNKLNQPEKAKQIMAEFSKLNKS